MTMRRFEPLLAGAVLAAGLASQAPAQEIEAKDVADMLHAVMESDRTVYTRMVARRLAGKEKVIKASEHFEDDKALALL